MANRNTPSHPVAAVMAVIFLAVLLAGLGFRFWAGDEKYRFSGPTHIAVGPDLVLVFAAGSIYHLTPAGELLDVIGPDRSGLDDDPIDLRVLSSGELLLAQQRPADIQVCRVGDWLCRPLGGPEMAQIGKQYKVLPLRTPGEFLVTDAAGDGMWRWGSEQGELKPVVSRGILAGPNDLALAADGSLWVADTDHRRLLELVPDGNGAFREGRTHVTVNSLTRGDRYYPMMLAPAADGRLWVTQATDFSRALADLLIYDPEAGVQAVVDLPEGAYATDVAAAGSAALVTDMERFTVYRVEAGSLEVSEFGDAVFRGALAGLAAKRRHYERIESLALAAMILSAIIMIVAAVRATPREKRWTQSPVALDIESAADRTPPLKGIHWLERNPRADRALKILRRSAYVIALILVATGIGFFSITCVRTGVFQQGAIHPELITVIRLLALNALLLVLLFLVVGLSLKLMQRQLGTDGKRLILRLADGRQVSALPEAIGYNRRVVLYRNHTMPLQGGRNQPLYLPDEIQIWLAPLLRHSQPLSEWGVIRHQWKHRDPVLMWPLGLIVLSLLGIGVTLAARVV